MVVVDDEDEDEDDDDDEEDEEEEVEACSWLADRSAAAVERAAERGEMCVSTCEATTAGVENEEEDDEEDEAEEDEDEEGEVVVADSARRDCEGDAGFSI